jgi:rRNA biogenesis protein RRP5
LFHFCFSFNIFLAKLPKHNCFIFFKAEELGLRPLNAIFQVGQLVTCAIVDVDKAENDFYKVTATLDPLTVNEDLIVRKNAIVMAAVKSVEDHGFVMDIGKANLKAFLPVKKADKIQPTLGQVLPCVVTKVDGSAVVLSCEPSKIRHNVVRDLAKVSVHTMCPGMTFDTVVEDNLKCGLKLKFGDFHGYVNIAHQGQDDVEVGQDVKATVVYVMPMINHIYMSIQEQDLSYLGGLLLKKEHETKIGALVKDATVLEADQRGLVISLAEDEMGIVPLKHLSEVQRKELKTKFGLNTKVTVRVLQFDQFERKFVCSMQKVLLEQNVIKSDQLKVGELVTCKAKKFVAKGLLVEVGRNLDGFIPMLHLSDVPLKHPEKKFSIGSKMRCKVSVNIKSFKSNFLKQICKK